MSALIGFDARYVFEKRPEIVASSLNENNLRQNAYVSKNRQLVAYASLMCARETFRLGRLYVDNSELAEVLILKLCEKLPKYTKVCLDLPDKYVES